ncbi:5-oxoprolinase subunit PxpB [Cupriavidus basilensis]|uniref:5-oxoprolinase subunit PxpB n=1 Tax=Cupriavidus basilensis TaxID=68895 RepID=A0ABT6AQA5_9BURK|nr:5-oxoprolinase subunit PxpB [Cupriavidus basilensis]MDF3834788.1 5-oxoprolinase subunit PxpB [Cupriavidus basilensis]
MNGAAISLLGTTAVQLVAAPPVCLETQQRIWAFSKEARRWRGVREVVPGMNNVTVLYDVLSIRPDVLQTKMEKAWEAAEGIVIEPSTLVVPVLYGGDFGPDLPAIAEHAGLSVEQVIEIHSNATYQVYFLGAHAGFAYLGGLDSRLHTPRLASPRLRVPAGSVAIGGAQAGVIAQDSPSGWLLLGRTSLKFFDIGKPEPALLAPGDIVRFVPEEAPS